MRHYIDSTRETDRWSLPDVNVFFLDGVEAREITGEANSGWFYEFGLPGCLPDSDPYGPYATETDALTAAREYSGYCLHGIAEDELCLECDQ